MKKRIITIIFSVLVIGGILFMADKNIQMGQRNSSNTEWDNHYPATKAENVITTDGNVASDLASIKTNKADKTYVDTLTASIASGSPKGTYATVAALTTAFPTGDTNIYVVVADGKWYYWNGTAWTAGGVYQATINPEIEEMSNQLNTLQIDLAYATAPISMVANIANPIDIVNNYYWDASGNLAPSASWDAIIVAVEPNTTYSVYNHEKTFSLFADASKNKIEQITIASGNITTPSNCHYLLLTKNSNNPFVVINSANIPNTNQEYGVPISTSIKNLKELKDAMDIFQNISDGLNLLRNTPLNDAKYWDLYGNMVNFTGEGSFGAYNAISLPAGTYMIKNLNTTFTSIVNRETGVRTSLKDFVYANDVLTIDYSFVLLATISPTANNGVFSFYSGTTTANTYIVGEGEDYKTIMSAVNASGDGDYIYVKSGTYREQIELWNKCRHLIGENRNTTIIIDSSGNYDTPPIEMSEGSLSNFTVIEDHIDKASAPEEKRGFAYCLHVEWTPRESNLTLFVDNCTFINTEHAPLGCGLYPDYTVHFRNCTFRCEAPDQGSMQRGSFYFHSNIGTNIENQNIIAENCIISSAGTKAVLAGTPASASGGSCRYRFTGCTIWSDQLGTDDSIVIFDNGSDATITKMINSYGNTVAALNSTQPNTPEN